MKQITPLSLHRKLVLILLCTFASALRPDIYDVFRELCVEPRALILGTTKQSHNIKDGQGKPTRTVNRIITRTVNGSIRAVHIMRSVT